MQLTACRPLRNSLTVATCSLLSLETAQAGYLDYDSLWHVDAAVLFYAEQNRVTVVEPVVQVKKEIATGEFVTVKLAFDTLSGATPNGAAPSSTPQTFTSPSGESSTTTAAHQLPLISFTDARAAASIDWELPLARTARVQYQANFSRETDYTALGAGATLQWDVNSKLTTLTAGIAANLDQVKPTGGLPAQLSSLNTGSNNSRSTSRSKNTYDALAGITQVLTRRTLMQLNFSYGQNRGYLTDPYKIVSVVDDDGATRDYLHEKRPTTRTRNSVYWKTVYHLPKDVVHVAYRYYWDDWAIKSGTVDLTYRLQLGARFYLEPHYRYYTQTAANFFTHAIVQGNTPAHASADLRLAALHSNSAGLRLAHQADTSLTWGLGIDYMHQSGNAYPANAVGALKNEALFSDLKATSITADFSMKF